MEETSPNLKTDNLCKVCGDKASGKHYGVASCDGCRGFFKRSIRRNLEYICKENGRCVVDVTRRNQCQSCRFKKCLQVNMKRDAVQHERAPRSSQPAMHYPLGLNRFTTIPSILNLGHSSSSTGESLGQGLPLPLPNHYVPHSFIYPSMFTPFKSSGFFQPPVYVKPFSFTTIKEDEVTSSEEVGPQPKTPEADFESKKPILNLFPTENIYESAAKLLFLSIKWAKSIPSFMQLSYSDQTILLEDSWNELFVLTAAQWSLNVDDHLLASNAISTGSKIGFLEEEARKLKEVLQRLNALRVDHTEHACLKALVLFKSEARNLCERSHVELLQDQTHVMLHEYCLQKHNVHKGRFGKLLLTLPAVHSISRRSLEELLFKQTVGDVAIERLLGDLAKMAH